MKQFSVLFVAPSRGVKPSIVAAYIFSRPFVDRDNSLVLTEGAKNPEWVPSGVSSNSVSDKSLSEFASRSERGGFDFLVSCGWGAKISGDALSIAQVAAVNCHSSYLPDYKGGSVYRYYWANCARKAGATVHFMTDKFDGGNIITQQEFSIKVSDKPTDILTRASEFTGPLLMEAMLLVAQGYQGSKQNDGRYFLRVSRGRLMAHRVVNRCLKRFGSFRWLSPHT